MKTSIGFCTALVVLQVICFANAQNLFSSANGQTVPGIQSSNNGPPSASSPDWEFQSDDTADIIDQSSAISFGESSHGAEGANGISGQNRLSAEVGLGRLGGSIKFNRFGGPSGLGEIIDETSESGEMMGGVGGMGGMVGEEGMSGNFGLSGSNIMDRFGRLIRGNRLGEWSGSIGSGETGGSIGLEGSGGSFGLGGSSESGGSFGLGGSSGSGGSFRFGGSSRPGGSFGLDASSGSGGSFNLGTDGSLGMGGSSESDRIGGLNIKYGRMDGHRGGGGFSGSNQIGGKNRMGRLTNGMSGAGGSGSGMASEVVASDRPGRMNGFSMNFGGASQSGGMSNFGASGESNGMLGLHTFGGSNRLRRHNILPTLSGGSLQVTRTPITLTWS